MRKPSLCYNQPFDQPVSFNQPNQQIYEMSQYQNGNVTNGDVVVSFNNMMTRNALVQTVESNRKTRGF